MMPVSAYLSAVKSPVLLGGSLGGAFSVPWFVFPPVIEMLKLRALCGS